MNEAIAVIALLVAAGLVTLGYWMGSRSSTSTLEAMRTIDGVVLQTNHALATVTQQASAAMNDPRLLQAVETMRGSMAEKLQSIESAALEAAEAARQGREATLMLAGPERPSVERSILSSPSPRPRIGRGPQVELAEDDTEEDQGQARVVGTGWGFSAPPAG